MSTRKSNYVAASAEHLGADSPIMLDEFVMEGENASAYLDVTAVDTPTTLDVKLQAKDPVSGVWADVGVSFAQVGVGPTSFERINVAGVWDLVLRWHVTIVGTSYTFSIGMAMSQLR